MGDIKPIETYYNGYRFRSRLEARWAVFFDAMGIEYQYEPDGFKATDFDNRLHCYLPDFYFPKSDCYGEVKPSLEKLREDEEKIAWCIDYKSTPISKGIIILGQIPYWDEPREEVPLFPFLSWDKGIKLTWAFWGNKKIHTDGSGIWSDCSSAPDFPRALWEECSNDLYLLDLRTFITIDGMFFEMESDFKASHSWHLKKAFLKARQARFEHGEKPII